MTRGEIETNVLEQKAKFSLRIEQITRASILIPIQRTWRDLKKKKVLEFGVHDKDWPLPKLFFDTDVLDFSATSDPRKLHAHLIKWVVVSILYPARCEDAEQSINRPHAQKCLAPFKLEAGFNFRQGVRYRLAINREHLDPHKEGVGNLQLTKSPAQTSI